MVLRSERIVIPVSVAEKERIITAADVKGFQMATWARATLLGETTSERKEKAASGRKEKDPSAMYAGDVAFFLKQDSGQKCEGSEQLYPRRGSLGKYPSAVCEFCRVEHFGQEIDPGMVQVREHLDGAQTGEEIGFIEPLGMEVMDTRFIGKEREGF